MHDQITFKYLEAHVREALAEDDRCNMLDVQIRVADQRVFLIGIVESEARRLAAAEVVREHVPTAMEVVNQLCIAKYDPPTEPEYLG